MPTQRSPHVSLRKLPKQARSNELVEAILNAALQVLAKEGARRFTTTRVAERAGVSVGSLYQYFPNKAAILFRLQQDEWRRTSDMLRCILEDNGKPPLLRLRALVHAFIRSECEEADVRVALNDAAPLYRDAPETREARKATEQASLLFIREALPDTPPEALRRTHDLIVTTLSAVGKKFSESMLASVEIEARADALADMLCAYLQHEQEKNRNAID
jgi:AcrR family transcriptional regulator